MRAFVDCVDEDGGRRGILCEFPRQPPWFVVSLSVALSLSYAYVDRKDLGVVMPSQGFSSFERYVTFLFAHLTVSHLISNLSLLLLSSLSMEMFHGSLRVAAIFFAGGVMGGVGQNIVHIHTSKGTTTLLVGASPGAFALAAAQFSNVLLNHDVMPLFGVRIFVLLVYVCSETLMSILEDNSHVAWESHVFGSVMGVFLGLCLLKNFKAMRHEVALRRTGAVGSVAVVTALLFLLEVDIG